MKTLAQLKENTSEVTDNILDLGFDLYDYCHQQADSDSRVIYYSEAWDYVTNHCDRDELEDEWKELGFEFTDLDTLMTQLAFVGVKKECERDAYNDIMEDLEKFRQAIQELEELNDDNPRAELEDAISDLEDAIQELEEYE